MDGWGRHEELFLHLYLGAEEEEEEATGLTSPVRDTHTRKEVAPYEMRNYRRHQLCARNVVVYYISAQVQNI